jgi:hypothetical protein
MLCRCRGVSWCKRRCLWEAAISINGKRERQVPPAAACRCVPRAAPCLLAGFCVKPCARCLLVCCLLACLPAAGSVVPATLVLPRTCGGCCARLTVCLLNFLLALLPLAAHCRLGFFKHETAAARAYDCVAAWRNQVLQRQHATREAKRGQGRRRGQKVRQAGAAHMHACGPLLAHPPTRTSINGTTTPFVLPFVPHPPLPSPVLPYPPLLCLNRPARMRMRTTTASRSRAA